MIATVDNFIRIFKFYQDNPLTQYYYSANGKYNGRYDREHGTKVIDPKTGKYKRITLNEIFKLNSLKYDDTVDIYLNSLVLDKYTQLSYDTDSEIVEGAVDAREKMRKYFASVLYPGSYAFNTQDNASFRKMILDWTSTIKTIQDSNKRLTDAYSLSSKDVDKALRGFGINFINSTSLISINKRKNFLLNVCDLYSIKGTPKSIVKALNIIGLSDIFIREGWMIKDNVDGNIKISWKALEEKSELNDVTDQYERIDTGDDLITDWDWFERKITDDKVHADPHWMYSKEDILNINDDENVYLKLPSITPYFGIEFVTDADKQIDSYETVYNEINKQFQKFLMNTEKKSDYKLWLNEFDEKLSILQVYTGLLYCLIRLDDHLLYENFRSFLKSKEFQNLPEITGKYEYFKLIYWFYRNYKLKDNIRYNLLYDFIPIKSSDYCSYEQVLRWWLETEYDTSEKDELDVLIISPNKTDDSPGFIQLSWTAPFAFGRYAIEAYSANRVSETCDGWKEIQNNNWSYDTNMQVIVPSEDADGFGSDVTKFRVIYYHTPNNIPDLFFNAPFNLNGNPQETFLDRTVRYNGPVTSLSYYNDNEIKNAFERHNIVGESTEYDVISGYHRNETMSTGIRVTDINTTLTSIYSSGLKYPNLTRLYEDKWMNINNDFYNFVDWSIKDFTDTQSHDGLLQNNRNSGLDENGKYRKYPVNSKWNWAVDSNYLYYCYESDRWARIPVNRFVTISELKAEYPQLTISISNYGDRILIGNKMYVYYAIDRFVEVDCITTWDVNDYDILPNCTQMDSDGKPYWKTGRIKENSELSRDLAVGLITDSTILSYIYEDCTLSPNDPRRSDILKTLKTEVIEVYKDPYNRVNGESYNYDTFLTYLYNSRLILDFDTGYIYPNYNTVKTGTNLFFKCSTSNGKDKIWVTIQPQFDWKDTLRDGVPAYSVYSDWVVTRTVDEETNKVTVTTDKTNSVNLGQILPAYTLPNRYDSLRFLDGPIFDNPEELQKASDNDQIDKSVNYVLMRPYTITNEDGIITDSCDYPSIYRRVIKMNDIYTDYTSVWEKCTENKFLDCNYGIGPNLLEFIESRYAQDDQYYITMVNDFTDLINNYMTEVLGIDGAILDLTIANYSTSGLVKKTINFYKPKRVRLLFTSNSIQGDYGIGNNLDGLFVGDQDFNYYDLSQYRYGNPEFNKKNLNRMNRVKIRTVIHDYLPFNDTIFKESDSSNQIYNAREIYDGDSKIPSLEVYDKLLNINQQTSGNLIAVFYVTGLEFRDSTGLISDSRINGFYYKYKDQDIYTNNIYFFKQVPFMYAQKNRGVVTIKTEYRWAIFKTDQTELNHTTCFYVADRECDLPYIDKTTNTSLKYALRDVKHYPKYIDSLNYCYGDFDTGPIIKTNKRIIEPVFYISNLDKSDCNGFYYQDSSLYPDVNGKPVYFNTNSKIITFTQPDWIHYKDYSNNYDCEYETVTVKVAPGSSVVKKENGRDVTVTRKVTQKDYSSTPEYDDTNNLAYKALTDELGNTLYEPLETNKFWIITDDKEIREFKDAYYFACAYINDETIWNPRNKDITKVFHKSTNPENDNLSWGIANSALYDNENLIDPAHGYIKPIYDKYSIYKRNHFNSVVLKNDPISYLYINNHVRNLYPDNRMTVRIFTDDNSLISQDQIDNYILENTNNTIAVSFNKDISYSIDKEGNKFGAISINSNNILAIGNIPIHTKNDWTISFRMWFEDQESINNFINIGREYIKPREWVMFTLTSFVDYDYYLNIATDILKKKSQDNLETVHEFGSISCVNKKINTVIDNIPYTDLSTEELDEVIRSDFGVTDEDTIHKYENFITSYSTIKEKLRALSITNNGAVSDKNKLLKTFGDEGIKKLILINSLTSKIVVSGEEVLVYSTLGSPEIKDALKTTIETYTNNGSDSYILTKPEVNNKIIEVTIKSLNKKELQKIIRSIQEIETSTNLSVDFSTTVKEEIQKILDLISYTEEELLQIQICGAREISFDDAIPSLEDSVKDTLRIFVDNQIVATDDDFEFRFDGISKYRGSVIYRYRFSKLISIRDEIYNQLISLIDNFEYTEFIKTPNNLSKALYVVGYTDVQTRIGKTNVDYNNFYINGKLIRNTFIGKDFFKNSAVKKVSVIFKKINAKLSEYALWDYALSDWYTGIITKFRILRSRPEPQKSKTSNSPNNYRPLFATEFPRTVIYPGFSSLQENIVGERFDGYNADPVYGGKDYSSEVNPLWKDGETSETNRKFYIKNGVICNYNRKIIGEGSQIIISDDYIADTNAIPYWWIRDFRTYRSGPVNQNIVYTSLKQKVDECYPRIKEGNEDKPGNYYDIGLQFDGINNIDNSYYDGTTIIEISNENKDYYDITFDPNSRWTSEYNRYVGIGHSGTRYIGWARDIVFEPVIVMFDDIDTGITARNFYPIDNSWRIAEIPLRFINLNNRGSTFDKSKIDDNFVIVPDTAQTELSEDYLSNGIFHNDLKFYTDDDNLNILNGTWIPKTQVDSWKDGDFEYCYTNVHDNITLEAVLTYQRNSGYFWWEFRSLENDSWVTVARTYVSPHWNQTKKMIWKDHVNWNQIDLVGQLICEFKEDDYEEFATKSWGEIKQNVIGETRFSCGIWVKFALQELTEEESDVLSQKDCFCKEKHLYFRDKINNKWYKTVNEIEDFWSGNSLENEVLINSGTISGFLYINNYLYFYSEDYGMWVRLQVNETITEGNSQLTKYYQPWIFNKDENDMIGYMNVIDSSNSDCFDNAYVIPDNIEIIETYIKLIKFNGASDFDWTKHVGEDMYYPKSVNNDVSICRISLKDSVSAYVYQFTDDSRTTKIMIKKEDYSEIEAG